jgi:metal-responsive CopG/Arc/MetJ family transcriptional regulator
MKTAISIPDRLFKFADITAKKLKISRSELYQKAIEKYVNDLDEDELLANLNKSYEKESSKLDKALENMQAMTILKATENDSW